MLPEPGRETDMRTRSEIARAPMAAEAKHKTSKQKKQDGPARRRREKRGKKEKEEKHEPLLACSSSSPAQLLLLRGRAPALQISATSNVRYRLLTLARDWHSTSLLVATLRCRLPDTVLLLGGQRPNILCATTSPASRSTETGRNGTRQRHAMPSISYPALGLHQCIHTAPGLIPSGRQLRLARPLGPEMGGAPHLLSSPITGRKGRAVMSHGHPGVLIWQGGHAGPSAASSQHARAAQACPVAGPRPNQSSDLNMANIGCTMYAECYRPTTADARALQSTV